MFIVSDLQLLVLDSIIHFRRTVGKFPNGILGENARTVTSSGDRVESRRSFFPTDFLASNFNPPEGVLKILP